MRVRGSWATDERQCGLWILRCGGRWDPLEVSYDQSHPAVQLGPRIPKSFNVDLHVSTWSMVLAICPLCVKMHVCSGPSLAVQWLGLCGSTAGRAWVWSLVRELRSCKPRGAAPPQKKDAGVHASPGNHIFLARGTFQNISLGSMREAPVLGDSSWKKKKRLSCAVPSALSLTSLWLLGKHQGPLSFNP